jgi:membrane-bound metal-dependent hydrolase YbcI (DUF457 family)
VVVSTITVLSDASSSRLGLLVTDDCAQLVTKRIVLTAEQLALLGFCVGAGGIVIHLLGGVITVSRIQPLLPFLRWEVSLSLLRAANTFVNNGLFVLGVLAIVAVGA